MRKNARRVISGCLSIICALCATISSSAATTSIEDEVGVKSYSMGDVNHDGVVNVADVTQYQRKLAGLTAGSYYAAQADFDGNGRIDIADATNVQLYAIGKVFMFDNFLYTVTKSKGTITAYNGTKTVITVPCYDPTSGCNITTIGESALENKTKITSVTVSAGIKNIGYYAFRDCKALRTVVIKNADCHIDSSSFDGCNITSFKQG